MTISTGKEKKRGQGRDINRRKEQTMRREYVIKKCAWCGDEFETIAPNQKYCNALCRYESYMENRHNKEYMKNYMREYRARKKMEQKGEDNE